MPRLKIYRNGAWEYVPSVALGGGSGDMLKANNLSDVVNVITARNNILPSKTGNTLKFLRVKADESDYELSSVVLPPSNYAVLNSRTVTDANATMISDDYTIKMSTGASNRTVNLLAGVVGQILIVKKIDNGAGIISFVSTTTCTIDSVTDKQVISQYESFTLQCVVAGENCEWDLI